jgi:hypothetical protein
VGGGGEERTRAMSEEDMLVVSTLYVQLTCSDMMIDRLKEFFSWQWHNPWSDSYQALEVALVMLVETTGTNHVAGSFVRLFVGTRTYACLAGVRFCKKLFQFWIDGCMF